MTYRYAIPQPFKGYPAMKHVMLLDSDHDLLCALIPVIGRNIEKLYLAAAAELVNETLLQQSSRLIQFQRLCASIGCEYRVPTKTIAQATRTIEQHALGV
jgi:hypothetical protein